jgi:hypothetical protein
MVEIRVAVKDATRASALMSRLARLFDRSSISFDRSRTEVRVESEWESRAVGGVVDAVEAWLAEDDGDWAMLSMGHRSYRLGSAGQVAANR